MNENLQFLQALKDVSDEDFNEDKFIPLKNTLFNVFMS